MRYHFYSFRLKHALNILILKLLFFQLASCSVGAMISEKYLFKKLITNVIL